MSDRRAAGKVYIVGAGPGDPGLITVRGLAALRRADVVVYDRLIAPALLGEAPLEAERICAAKAPGRERMSQRRIEALLVARARAGRTVVRLKGGDPFVFGRGGEEVAALVREGIPFEVIPGVSSAVAVPAAAGIPVTHRDVSDGFAVWTAHRSGSETSRTIDAPTQVILMGVDTLPQTAAQLMASGRAPSTPAAVISWGTTARQRAVFGTLADIVERVERAGLESPATIVVGDVVALAAAHGVDTGEAEAPGQPRGAHGGAHAGMRVVVTRSSREDDALVDRLEAEGAEVARLPLLSPSSRPVPQMVRCLCDLVDEKMVDAVIFDGDRSLEAVREFVAAERLSPELFASVAFKRIGSNGEVVDLPGLFASSAWPALPA